MKIIQIDIDYISNITGQVLRNIYVNNEVSLEDLCKKLYQVKRFYNYREFYNIFIRLDDGITFKIMDEDIKRLNIFNTYPLLYMFNLRVVQL